MDLKNKLIEPDDNSATRFEPFYQITPKELEEICKEYHMEQLRISGGVVPKVTLCDCEKPNRYYCLKTGGDRCRKCKKLL